MIVLYFGRIGSGKTYCATADILTDLKRGQVWYCNWRIAYDGYNEEDSWFALILGVIGLKREYRVFPKENLKYIDISDSENVKVDGESTGKDFISWLSSLTDCKLGLDEGHVAFDSYEKTRTSIAKRNAVLWTRHYDRSYLIISQRPSAIHVTMRANVNRFYKHEKVLSWPFIVFKRSEYQDMTDETVDESDPVSTKWYLAKKSVMQAYDSKYLRGDTPQSQRVQFEAFKLNYIQKIIKTLITFFGAFMRRKR